MSNPNIVLLSFTAIFGVLAAIFTYVAVLTKKFPKEQRHGAIMTSLGIALACMLIGGLLFGLATGTFTILFAEVSALFIVLMVRRGQKDFDVIAIFYAGIATVFGVLAGMSIFW